MKARWLTIFLMLVAALAATTKFAYDLGKVKKPGKTFNASCQDLTQACRVNMDGTAIELMFSPEPALLKPFMLTVKVPGAKDVVAVFTMVGMDMGINRYRLQAVEGGHWQAKIILPACISRRSDWLLTLEIDGYKVKVPFSAAKAGG